MVNVLEDKTIFKEMLMSLSLFCHIKFHLSIWERKILFAASEKLALLWEKAKLQETIKSVKRLQENKNLESFSFKERNSAHNLKVNSFLIPSENIPVSTEITALKDYEHRI